jgi:hypothetical protein
MIIVVIYVRSFRSFSGVFAVFAVFPAILRANLLFAEQKLRANYFLKSTTQSIHKHDILTVTIFIQSIKLQTPFTYFIIGKVVAENNVAGFASAYIYFFRGKTTRII